MPLKSKWDQLGSYSKVLACNCGRCTCSAPQELAKEREEREAAPISFWPQQYHLRDGIFSNFEHGTFAYYWQGLGRVWFGSE